MKRIKFLLFLTLANMAFAQNKLFLYDYKFIPDSISRDNSKNELMILNIQKDRSEFYSSERYSSDSTQLAESKKGIMAMPFSKEMISDRVIKFPNSNLIIYITFLSWDKYIIKQDIDLKWTLENDFSKILNYDVQKATIEFGGRKWIAWFTKEIPIQDGPYKFKNLPGLILKIEDSNKNHTFELKGIKSATTEFDYPNLNNYKEYKLSYDQYVKKYKNYRKNPTADLVDKIPDQRDANGNFRTSTQIIRELNNQWLERFKKDNNIIEVNLLQ
ncbi:GLPGLI family protein [Kaistella flava (ex Peng et al. 2021)]|uniref:GLPGLI family protein n=1 Tax=Kaistella flava (ex Peng et al. 2021) TaxID=2038776 RepID=A0A7M2Y639_9FLAO|nr:GLPGLI family protein [Kaistella flava (ex Peng et al. 2021)]QOW09556.1 GLPGLI family protein [Kaistella flava (ex Peng et al. 2021)]